MILSRLGRDALEHPVAYKRSNPGRSFFIIHAPHEVKDWKEREVMHRALMKKQSIIHVCPQGIPLEHELSPEQRLALAEHRLLFISPQPSGSALNKKVATWCNEYVLRHAQEIWVGPISPNGMLAILINALRPE